MSDVILAVADVTEVMEMAIEHRRERLDLYTLLHKDHYTADELADLLEVDRYIIQHAAFSGELPATILDHHIVCIRRDDVLRWLDERR